MVNKILLGLIEHFLKYYLPGKLMHISIFVILPLDVLLFLIYNIATFILHLLMLLRALSKKKDIYGSLLDTDVEAILRRSIKMSICFVNVLQTSFCVIVHL